MIRRLGRVLVLVVVAPFGILWGLGLFAVRVAAGLAYRFASWRTRRLARRAHRALAWALDVEPEKMTGRLRFEAFTWDRSGRPEIDDGTRRKLRALAEAREDSEDDDRAESATSTATKGRA